MRLRASTMKTIGWPLLVLFLVDATFDPQPSIDHNKTAIPTTDSTRVLIRAKRQCCFPTQMVCCQQPQPIVPLISTSRPSGCDCLRLKIQVQQCDCAGIQQSQCGCAPVQQNCNCQVIQQQSDACGCGPLQYAVSCNQCQAEQPPAYLVVQQAPPCVAECAPTCKTIYFCICKLNNCRPSCIQLACAPACQPMCNDNCVQQQRTQVLIIPAQQQQCTPMICQQSNGCNNQCMQQASVCAQACTPVCQSNCQNDQNCVSLCQPSCVNSCVLQAMQPAIVNSCPAIFQQSNGCNNQCVQQQQICGAACSPACESSCRDNSECVKVCLPQCSNECMNKADELTIQVVIMQNNDEQNCPQDCRPTCQPVCVQRYQAVQPVMVQQACPAPCMPACQPTCIAMQPQMQMDCPKICMPACSSSCVQQQTPRILCIQACQPACISSCQNNANCVNACNSNCQQMCSPPNEMPPVILQPIPPRDSGCGMPCAPQPVMQCTPQCLPSCLPSCMQMNQNTQLAPTMLCVQIPSCACSPGFVQCASGICCLRRRHAVKRLR